MNTGKNRVKGLKTELFKKKYQTNPVVKNPTDELKGRTLTDMVNDQTKESEENLARQQAYLTRYPLTIPKRYTEKEIAKMKDNFAVPSDNYQVNNGYGITGIPDLTEGQGVNDIRTQEQILSETENTTSTPANIRAFQTDASQQELKAASKDALATTEDDTNKRDYRDYIRTGVGLTSAVKGIYDDVQTRQNVNERIQNLNDRPRYMPNEYDFMGRPGSQSVIYAKHGAEIRTGTNSGAEEAELERGEMFMLPNMDSYVVGGKKHSQGGEDFVLPEGTIVFSDHLKVPGLKYTFAEQAKKFDITKYKEVLENPHSKSVDRTTAEVMMDRNLKKLQELFQIQQAMNGNSNGEMEPEGKRIGQAGLFNVNQPQTFGPNAPSVLTPEQQKQYYLNQGMFNNPNYQQETAALNNDEATAVTQQAKKILGLQQYTEAQVEAERTKAAAQVNPNPSGVLGAEPQNQPNTATNIVSQTPDPNTLGTVGKTNATDPSSIYYKTLPNGKKVYVEGQGEFKGKNYRDQYGGDVFNLVRNRLNEYGETLNPTLLSSYQLQIKDKNLMVGDANELVDIMESGNHSLESMRQFYKGIGMEDALFNPELDRSKDGNESQKKTAQLFADYVKSPQYLADVKAGKASTYIPWLKNQPKPVKNAKGEVTAYTLDSAEMNSQFTEQYQAAYKAFGAVKQTQKGKSVDMLKGFRIAPEGLSDHMWMGLPISPVDTWGGNTTIGQISAFEDEEPKKPKKPIEPPGKTRDEGNTMNTQLENASMGKYTPERFDYPQLAPEIYGMAASQMFAYAPMDYNAPYVMPQTLNIQPQLQDVDNSYMAALNSGADPNSALIATLGAKQKLYSEKQNFDAQQRAQVDQVNANARWQEDVYDMQSLDRVYNTLIAGADDAVAAQRQALIKGASDKRAVWKMEEARKQFWYNNFVRSFDYDPKTRSLVVKKDANKEFVNQLGTVYGGDFSIPEVDGTEASTTTNTNSTTK
jgi:hypothetical protein